MQKAAGIITILLGFWLLYLAFSIYNSSVNVITVIWMSGFVLAGLSMIVFAAGTFNKNYTATSTSENRDIIDFDYSGQEEQKPRPGNWMLFLGWVTVIASGLVIAGLVYGLLFVGLGGWIGSKDIFTFMGMLFGSACAIFYSVRTVMWKR